LNLDREEMTSEGMMALLGGRYVRPGGLPLRTTPVTRSSALCAGRDAGFQAAQGSPDHGIPEPRRATPPESRHDDQRALFEERLQRILDLEHAALTDVEKSVLSRRFPAQEGRERQTLEDIGRQMRVSKERVRQIQLSAISKLRRAIGADTLLQ
jgi:hypothetical protein